MCDNTLDWMFINQFSIPENNNIQITLYFKHFTNTYHLFLFLSHHKLYCVYIIFFFSLGVGYSILNTPNRSMWSPLVIEEKHTKKTYLMKFCNHLIFFFIGFNHFICLWLVSISLIEIFQYRRGYILQTKSSKITRTFLRLPLHPIVKQGKGRNFQAIQFNQALQSWNTHSLGTMSFFHRTLNYSFDFYSFTIRTF